MTMSIPAARIMGQVLRDMPTNGIGEVRTDDLATFAEVSLHELPGIRHEVLAELALRVLDAEYSFDVGADVTTIRRSPAQQNLIVFCPATDAAAAQAISLDERQRLADELIATIPATRRDDAAGRRRILDTLAKRPSSEVAEMLEGALLISKTQSVGYWPAVMKRLGEAADEDKWLRRLDEVRGLAGERQRKVDMLADVYKLSTHDKIEETAPRHGVYARRVIDEIARLKALETTANDNAD